MTTDNAPRDAVDAVMAVLKACVETAKERVREVSYPVHRTLGQHTGAFTHCQDGACRGLLGVLVALNVDEVEPAVRAAVERAMRGLMLAGDDVAAALSAAMDADGLDVESVEHCNAMIERWIERTEHLRERQRGGKR